MDRSFLLLAAVGVFVCGGCASGTSLTLAGAAAASRGPEAGPTQATNSVTSEKENVVVLKLLTPRFSNRTPELPAVWLSVTNRTKQKVPFSMPNISARSAGKPVRPYNAYELRLRIQNDAGFDRFTARALGDARTRTLAMLSPNGPTTVLESQVATLHNEQSATWKERGEMSKLRSLIYPMDIDAGQTIAGVLKLHAEDISRATPLSLEVQVGTEIHTFTLSVGG